MDINKFTFDLMNKIGIYTEDVDNVLKSILKIFGDEIEIIYSSNEETICRSLNEMTFIVISNTLTFFFMHGYYSKIFVDEKLWYQLDKGTIEKFYSRISNNNIKII